MVTACATPATPAAPALATARHIAWSACYEPAKHLECARVAVPLDWNRPAGRQIELAVIRRRASNGGARLGSLFLNWGGPGVAGVPKVRAMAPQLDAIGKGRFDVVSWDPRGTGESTPVECFSSDEKRSAFWGRDWSVPTTSAQSSKYVPKAEAFVRRCASRSGDLLAHVSTADTVRDLDYLRQLAGDAQLNYRGISYGTFIGQTYAAMFPQRVRAMVLDGVLDPVAFTTSTERSIAGSIAAADVVFDKFQSLCQSAGPRCALAGHGAVAPRVHALLARLRRAPIGALTYGDTLLVLWIRLGTPGEWPGLAVELDKADRGDGSALETTAREAKGFILSALDSAVALQCADKPFPPSPGPQAWPGVIGRLSDASFISGPVNGWLLWVPCASWTARSVDRFTGPWSAHTKAPILVIGTRFDPNTAYAAAVAAVARLGNAVLLTHDGYGHTSDADPSTCVDRATATYLVDLVAPHTGTVCRSNLLPFDPHYR
ncbi:MAG TPA: alpha/beta fold hydrolase [Candidatus Acidoferrales bacterium]|jgi:pimeloyl-ACP methyl ester carboxylesterase|nr:alpha/beta fold hydrolase [Candidatus Acidoferrales bacterium]